MKKTINIQLVRVLGIIALTALIGFSFAACGGDSEPEHVHQWGEWVETIAPTCTTGEETRTCKLDATHKETRSTALGHDWGGWVETTAPSYTAEGEETRTCLHDSSHTETRTGAPQLAFTVIADFAAWLAAQPANTVGTAYSVKLNISGFGGFSTAAGSVGNALISNETKYVNLDLSGSAITSIGYRAFNSCTSLTGITIPDSVTSIEGNVLAGAFSSCTSLTSVTIPNSVTSIGYSAFNGCVSLASITIPNSVTSIGDYAFWGCASLTSVTFATGSNISDTNFGDNAFPEGSSGDGGDALKTAYSTGKAGTYIRNSEGSVWSKPKAITIAAITGVTVPAVGGKPVTSITNEQYSGTVSWSPVPSGTRTVKIDMYDSQGDGWDGSGALRIVVNGAEKASGIKVQTTDANNNPSGQRSSNTYSFNVAAGDTVQVYWVAGTYQNENSFIMYYTDAPPSPEFSNPTSWSGTGSLLHRLRTTTTSGTVSGTLQGTAGGTLLGTFTTAYGTFAGSTVYTATITLTGIDGFITTGVGANFFTVVGATSVSNSANSGVVTAVFPATSP